MAADPKIEEVSSALGSPVIDELSATARKVRSLLLSFALITVLLRYDIVVLEKIAPVGLELKELSQSEIEAVLYLITLYFLVHYLVLCADFFGGWRLRLTGTRLSFQTGSKWGNEACDYPSDPRASNLYNWWQDNARRVRDFGRVAAELEKTSQQLANAAKEFEPLKGGIPNQFFSQAKADIDRYANDLKGRFDQLEKIISSRRIDVSLKRFDEWFKNVKMLRVVSLIVFELLTPVIVAIAALYP